MISNKWKFALAALAMLAPTTIGVCAQAEQIHISVTNSQPGGGFAFSPVWFGLHDGSFSSFNAGDNLAGQPLQAVAELANTGPITSAFAGAGPETTVGSAPIMPGVTRTADLKVGDPATTRFLNFASMVVPSNDFFFGNDNAHPLALFDTSGHLIDANGHTTRERTILVFGRNVWDAGTEVNDPSFGAAFLVGVDITDHVAEGGTAQLVFGGPTDYSSYLNSINGRATPGGYDISHLISRDDLIATIRISAVPEPSALSLAAVGLAGTFGAGWVRRFARRKGLSEDPNALQPEVK